jgi:hypothetical protein
MGEIGVATGTRSKSRKDWLISLDKLNHVEPQRIFIRTWQKHRTSSATPCDLGLTQWQIERRVQNASGAFKMEATAQILLSLSIPTTTGIHHGLPKDR